MTEAEPLLLPLHVAADDALIVAVNAAGEMIVEPDVVVQPFASVTVTV